MSEIAVPASAAAGDLVAWARARLAGVTDSARLEAELLLGHSASLDRTTIMAYPERAVAASGVARLVAAVARRSRGEPLAYIVGQREFYSLSLAVGPEVLVPRPETELVVERALALAPARAAGVLDLGTGSGAIALALKSQRPDLVLLGVDCSSRALEIARRNALALGIDVSWLRSHWFDALGSRRFDLIVSNPPYVPSRDPHFGSALGFEPRLALDGGADGLEAYRAILAGAGEHLTAAGLVVVEHGVDQREALVALAAGDGFRLVAAADDLAGRPRVAVFAQAHGD